jgi:hypothetical protein
VSVPSIHTWDPNAADRGAVGGVALGLVGEVLDTAALVGEAGQRASLDRRGRGAFDLAQFTAQMVLFQERVERRDRLLPDERHDGIHERQGTEDDQGDGSDAQRARRGGPANVRARNPCGGRWREF